MDILITVLSSSAIVGIFVFLFKEGFRNKIELLKKDIDAIKSYQTRDYDQCILAMKKIWEELAEIDDYTRHVLAEHIKNGEIKSMSVRKNYLTIRKEMALLPEEIYEATERCLKSMLEHWHVTMRAISNEVEIGRAGIKSHKVCAESVNSKLDELRNYYRNELSELRKMYREYILKHTGTT